MADLTYANVPLALAVIGTHLTAAGAAASPSTSDVLNAYGVPKGRSIRYWFDGDGPSKRMGAEQTLGHQMSIIRVKIIAFAPLSSFMESLTAAVDAETWILTFQIISRLVGDKQLGGNCVDMTVGDADVQFPVISGSQYRTVEIDLALEYPELYPIGA